MWKFAACMGQRGALFYCKLYLSHLLGGQRAGFRPGIDESQELDSGSTQWGEWPYHPTFDGPRSFLSLPVAAHSVLPRATMYGLSLDLYVCVWRQTSSSPLITRDFSFFPSSFLLPVHMPPGTATSYAYVATAGMAVSFALRLLKKLYPRPKCSSLGGQVGSLHRESDETLP
ncbi:uncharacterized protein LY79DRAFT_552463 [Colletotrichum navitas]|uniref:Uncharacterized protein n=1 Tax=Colletotrichum navitas TaxID=681940 RepID=A0AAD8Q0S9_9PEZI|nr:uncharacterized protein LY79DRAFT_552463 [Colletotrichum navitas]KAK1593320.1 hypothetical protein LY79DRAFT_552463 [Colletotrichum navitas]